MPRLVNCIKNCLYLGFLAIVITAICSLFVWQAEVYQSTIDEQIRSMKLELASIKKENHLMEIKLNEQLGKHDDLKEEFRYLIKQAKWPADVSLDRLDKRKEEGEDGDVGRAPHPVEAKEEDADDRNLVNKALEDAIGNLEIGDSLDHPDIDLSKRSQILLVSETAGGRDVLGGFLDNDSSVFYLPEVSQVAKSGGDFQKLAHCTITEAVLEFYKDHPEISAQSKSLKKFCSDGSCGNMTVSDLKRECLSRYVAVLGGASEDWSLSVIDDADTDTIYVSRDPRSIVSDLLQADEISEESIQGYSTQLCSRLDAFSKHESSSHHVYHVVKYESLAKSPLTSLASLYHSLLDTTDIPKLALSREFKNQLYLSISTWKTQLAQILVDAVEEECGSLVKS